MSNNKNHSNIFPYNTSNSKRNNTSKRISNNNNKKNDMYLKSPEELRNIFNLILSELSQSTELKFTTNDLLSLYIRRNRNKLNETLIEISKFFKEIKINP